jgi:hypothetical protein
MIKIHDIKPLEQIPDNSIYFYYGLIIFSILFIIILFYFIYTFFKQKKISLQMQYFKILQNIDFNNQKETAYCISKYGQLLIKDEQQIKLFKELNASLEELNASLEEFKYKKEISQSIPNSIKLQYNKFMEILNVK